MGGLQSVDRGLEIEVNESQVSQISLDLKGNRKVLDGNTWCLDIGFTFAFELTLINCSGW